MRQQLFDTAAYAHRGGQTSPAPMVPTMGRLFDTSPFAAKRPATAAAVSDVRGGTQPKMFMTPREIHAGWSPLDGDREDSYDSGGGSWQGSSAFTGREYNSQGEPNSYYDDTSGGGAKYRRNTSGIESDEQLWDRKLEESQEFSKHGQYEDADSDPLHRGGRGGSTMGSYQGAPTGASQGTPSDSAWDRHYSREGSWENRRQEARYDQGESLYDSIRSEGVRGPIRLGQQIGSMGKPQVVGGHHRLAAATDINPNRLVPVLHDWDIHSAREQAKQGGYPYS